MLSYEERKQEYRQTCIKMLEKGMYDFDVNEIRYISTNRKTESFLRYCDINNIDVDETVEKVLKEGDVYDFSRNHSWNAQKNAWAIIIRMTIAEVSKELLYCKASINYGVLYLVFHRSESDLK